MLEHSISFGKGMIKINVDKNITNHQTGEEIVEVLLFNLSVDVL